MVPVSQEQQTALQIIQTSNSIATPEQLAAVIDNPAFPRYGKLEDGQRVTWIGQQISALHYMAHSQKIPSEFDLFIEASMLDQIIMDDEGSRNLTLLEIQEAFRRGITREYGDFYGITAASLSGFLNGFRRGEKRQKAIAILYERSERERKEKDALFFKELHRHYQEQGIPLPDFKNRPLETISSEEHRRKIQQQANEILNRQKEA